MANDENKTAKAEEERPLSNAAFDRQAKEQEALDFGELSKQPKIRILLPKNPGDKKNHPQMVFINGVAYSVPRGVSVEVPLDVAEVLKNAEMV